MSKHGTILKQGEAESRTVVTTNSVVTLHHVTEHKALGQVVMDWGFDFEGVAPSKIMELAARSLVIDQRNTWKKLDAKEASSEEQTSQVFHVSDLLNKQRRGKSVAEKLADLTKGMSKEQVTALLEVANLSE